MWDRNDRSKKENHPRKRLDEGNSGVAKIKNAEKTERKMHKIQFRIVM